MRITFVISTMIMGGAQRALSNMANYWASKQWHITILVLDNKDIFYELRPDITVKRVSIATYSTNIASSILNTIRRTYVIRKAIAETYPDGVISFIDICNIRTILATRFTKYPVIVSERIDPATYRLPQKWNILRKLSYPFADALVVQTDRAANHFASLGSKLHVIPNPLVPIKSKPSGFSMAPPSVVAAGRLEYQKGFDLLIRAFARLRKKHPDWSLYIFGEGSLNTTLQKLARDVGAEESIHLPGKIANLPETLKQADIFVLPSRFEGFPNVLCEAMATGRPVIAADCRSGPREIVTHGEDGLLFPVEDLDELTRQLEQLVESTSQRKKLGAAAAQSIERLSIQNIMSTWERLIHTNKS